MTRRHARRPVCVLVSGGLDSCVLAAEQLRAGRRVYPLYVREGMRWERAELHWLKRFLRRLQGPGLEPLSIIDAPARPLLGGRHWSLSGRGGPKWGAAWTECYLPGRNLLLLAQAGVFCSVRGVAEIMLATLKGNPFGDATPRFRRAMAGAFEAAFGGEIRITLPYERLRKEAIPGRVPGLPLELTFSCVSPKGLSHCGRCAKCEERTWALGQQGLAPIS